MPPEVETTAPPEPLFRASKRRKVFRRRDSDEEHQADSKSLSSTEAAILSSLPTSDQPADVHEEHHVEAPRRAQSSKPRRFGVAFSSNSNSQTPNRTLPQHEATSLAPAKEPEASATDEVSARFAPQTGIVVGKYDKQMCVLLPLQAQQSCQTEAETDMTRDAFVEAEMAKIRAGGSAVTRDAVIEQMKSSARGKLSNREATTLGKLQEVELSGTALDARRKNDKSTADAREGGMQLGKNGKPRRKRWRRGSEDLKRDDLVDAILRESKGASFLVGLKAPMIANRA